MGLLSILGFGSSGCLELRADKGDAWAQKLRIGMPLSEVHQIMGAPKSKLDVSRFRYLFYLRDRTPYDLLRNLEKDASCWSYPYPVSSMTDHAICIFSDEQDRVIGWVKHHSELSRDKFMHEKLTAQLRADTLGRGMTRAEVYSQIGKPEVISSLPREQTEEFYEDRYWTEEPLSGIYKDMEVYSYRLANGQTRNVFLIYATQADKLHLWGYDHAWEEAERYLAEQAAKKKQ